ncbi:acyl-CoA desaturase [Erythrobacter sp. F6033]|uniref:acyl-CoA desaturase n=1 Tax=Erythrobacter sp. F6033 TaxID=2926401 RepID=UPI001FF12A8C|nr:acyl-CoA desaturase [Erythrobacter sp. F6033]MCK0127906.1 acyl-CoA desaturase [Erythrobacter sp. F6033]
MERDQGRDRCEVNWIVETPEADPAKGKVRWDPVHSMWNGGMLIAAIAMVPFFTTPAAVAVGMGLTGLMLLLGHSVGFHRLLIHGSFETAPWLRPFLIWCGTVAGMSGPIWIVRTHDLRDWAQRQSDCHDYLAHRRPMLIDAWWQLHCTLKLENPPEFDLSRLEQSRFIRWMERTWMLHQIPVAALLFWLGGWPFVVWGVFVRVALTVHGHWFVGHLAHRRGPQSWRVKEAGVQAHDVPWAGLITMGEAWHNNHHAYPGSARIGLKPGQSDWGYRFIQLLERIGLAWDICLPSDMAGRDQKLETVRKEAATSRAHRSAPRPPQDRAASTL